MKRFDWALLASTLITVCAVFGAVLMVDEAVEDLEAKVDEVVEEVAPLVGPGFIDSYEVACGVTATVIEPAVGNQVAYECQVDDAAGADVFFGDDGVTTSVYGAAKGAGEFIGGNARREYCIVASGTITIHCRGLVPRAPSGGLGAFSDAFSPAFD